MVFPQFVGVFGQAYVQERVIEMVRFFGIAVTPLVLLNVILNYGLAKHMYKFIYVMAAGIFLYVGLLNRFHHSFMEVLFVMFGVNLLILAGSVIALKLEGDKRKR
jgi:hypothetical protein